ncbi:MAG: sugar ABC transporter permease [Paenibacillaceae bacterium]
MRRSNYLQWKETLTGYLFIAPTLLGLTVFFIIPILATILLSFTEWNFIAGVDKIKFIGLDNFTKLFQDAIFIQSLKNNLILLISIPITVVIALLLAIILNKHVYFKNTFKVIYFTPYISSVVAIAIVYQVLFHPSHGPVNQFLMSIGIDHPPTWLADTTFAIYSVLSIQVWISIGFYLIIYIAGLQGIPKDLYEAADIDGATRFQKTRFVTVPMLSPTTFFLIVTGVIYTFRIFDLIKVLTSGGPANSTTVMVYYLYDTAFVNLKTGYASAMGLILLVMVLIITIIQLIGQKKWVNY